MSIIGSIVVRGNVSERTMVSSAIYFQVSNVLHDKYEILYELTTWGGMYVTKFCMYQARIKREITIGSPRMWVSISALLSKWRRVVITPFVILDMFGRDEHVRNSTSAVTEASAIAFSWAISIVAEYVCQSNCKILAQVIHLAWESIQSIIQNIAYNTATAGPSEAGSLGSAWMTSSLFFLAKVLSSLLRGVTNDTL